MIQQVYEVIVNKIVEKSGLSRADIEAKVDAKVRELEDLVTKEGAAHMVANELKIQLFDTVPKVAKIENLSPGMNNVVLTGKVLNVFEPRTFNSGTRSGRVANITVGDETGTVRVVCWDENIMSEFLKAKEGDILKVRNGYVKQNNQYNELHLGNKAQIQINPEGETIGEVKQFAKASPVVASRKYINDLAENQVSEVFATIVQIFEPKFYTACPVCNKKVFPQGEAFNCAEHGSVVGKQVPILNVFIDDGTGNIRAVCFREHAEKLIGPAGRSFDEVKKSVAGKQMLFKGKLVKNAMFNRSEFVISSVEDADPARLIVEMENV